LPLPDAHRLITGTRGQQLPIGGPGHVVNATAVSFEGSHKLVSLPIPQPHRLIIGTGGQQLPIGGPGHAVNDVGVPSENVSRQLGKNTTLSANCRPLGFLFFHGSLSCKNIALLKDYRGYYI